MDHKKQRIASIIIGLIIAIFIFAVGIRIVQRRQSRATAPKNLTCIISGSEGIVKYSSADPEPGIVNYTTEASYNANQQFSFIAEADNSPKQAEGGVYDQEIKIGPLVANTNYVVKVGDQIATCTASGGEQSAAGLTPTQAAEIPSEPVNPTSQPMPEQSAVESTPIPQSTIVQEEPVQAAQTGLTSEKVDKFYEDNPNGSIKDCSDAFKDEKDANGDYYTNLGQACAEGWAKKNLSK